LLEVLKDPAARSRKPEKETVMAVIVSAHSANCSCLRNGLSCTALCKCTDCSNVQMLNLCEDIDNTDM